PAEGDERIRRAKAARRGACVVRDRVRRWIWLAIAGGIGAAAYVLVGDVHDVGDRLGHFGWSAFAAALGLALANYAVRFVRWQLYLRRQDVRVPLASSVLAFGAGLSLSITPGKVGELVKSFLLREMHGVPARRTAPIVIAERVTDLIALIVLAVIGVAVYGVQLALVVASATLVALGLVFLAWPRPTRALIDLVTRPRRLRRLRDPLQELYRGVAALCRPRLLVTATALAVPAWAAECIGFAAIVNAFPGAHVELGLAIVIYAATTIAGALSFLPGGLGVTEGGMTLLLVQSAAALGRATALDATLLTRLATLWFAVALGLVCLALARRRIAKLALGRAPSP
ncbi:MAG TPA: lysylphosphatidylglycerol synthase transmembrane domain-containing protein, partial [Kofleriaceae bacterium]|nr:lysylphosphatidylglycerol synthase transmembrane domain-containing protein [Kofleriaceae bacterium]